MAPRRIDYPGAWHHVMNRGARHGTVFHVAADGERFLDLVGQWSAETGIEVHAYCLMDNHYHLLVRSATGELSWFMQRVGAGYTQYLNHRLGQDGAVFRGRFRSRLVDTDAYLAVLNGYIHRNPTARHPPPPLDEYRWSSYGAYVGTAPAPDWLNTGVLLERCANDVEAFRSLVERPPRTEAPDLVLELIAIVLDEHSARLRQHTVRLERVMATALLDHLPSDVAQHLRKHLGYGDDATGTATLRRARARARERVASDPVLREILLRTLVVLGYTTVPAVPAAVQF